MKDALVSSAFLCSGLFVVMVAVLAVSLRKNRNNNRGEADLSESMKLSMSSVFALLGLLIAFTFSNAYSRLLLRRQLIVNETNAIGTAYYRLDLVSAPEQSALRGQFRSYLDLRTRFYSDVRTAEDFEKNLKELQALQKVIWAGALAGTSGPSGETPRRLLLPALNTMFDVTTDRAVAFQAHMPTVILFMLLVLPLVCAFMLGHNSYQWRHFFYAAAFSFVICFVLYVIIDIDHPRRGLVRLDQAERQLENLRQTMQ